MSARLKSRPPTSAKTVRPHKWMPDWDDGTIYTYERFERAVRAKSMLYVEGFFRGKPVSAVMVGNLAYSLVTHLISNHRMCVAVRSPLYQEWLRAELLGWDMDRTERPVLTESGLCLMLYRRPSDRPWEATQ